MILNCIQRWVDVTISKQVVYNSWLMNTPQSSRNRGKSFCESSFEVGIDQ